MASTLADYAALVLDDPAVSGEFRTVVGQLSTSDESIARLDEFISVAHQRMPCSDGRHWRMLYIDASILKVLARASVPRLQVDAVRECISTLDRAIIVAGATLDDARRDCVVHEVIKRLQAALPHQRPPSSAVLAPKPAPVLDALPTARNTVRALTTLPSVVAPHKRWSRAPFVVRRYADDWPAMRQPHQWASLAYLFSVAGPGRTVPVEVGNDYRSDDWSQKLVSWEDFLSSLEPSADPPHRQHHTVYLAQHSLFAQFPGLREDLILPDIVYASLDSPDFPAYVPPHDAVLNAWLGPRGTISPAHTDPYFNCYVQVVGRKTVWLAPPKVAAAMYPCHASLAGADAASTTSPPMSNTSQVDVFASALHEIEASQSAFPLFWDTVPVQASFLTLNPGDMLFFPPGWWHAMRSEDASFSVSMWF